MNPFGDALDALTVALQAAVGGGVTVTRDPARIGPQVAAQGVAVLVGAGVPTEVASYKSWAMDVPVHVCFPSPANPHNLDPAYQIAHQLMDVDYFTRSVEVGAVQLDAAMSLPAVTVTLQTATEC